MANATEYNMNRDSPQKSQSQNIETVDKATISTLKRNPKIEFCKTDLLKLLTYLEGELQARDIVIATLKSDKLKQYLAQTRHLSQRSHNDPVAALHRDSFAVLDNSRDNAEMCLYVNHQLNSLDNLVIQQKRSQARVARVLKEAEMRHRKEIELEIQHRKKYEREYHKLNEILEAEKSRHKQIVLFLLAERKKIIMKYVEERKRSEDLAQILGEEKSRVDAMAEGLEEESKKSLQMEAELEKQLAQFFVETQQLKGNLAKQERRSKELESELEKSQKENLLLRQQLNEIRQVSGSANFVASPSISDTAAQSTNTSSAGLQCVTPMMTSIAKVVQPTATVSSVPVSGPMTGIARSVSPGQHVRYVMYSSASPLQTQVVNSGKHGDAMQSHIPSPITNTHMERPVVPSATVRSATIANSPHPKMASSPIAKNHSGEAGSTSTVTRKPIPLGRGVPPPVPPNKPIVPPKKDVILGRKIETVVAENVEFKNSSQIRPAVLPTGKVKLPNSTEKQNDRVNNDLIAENPG